MAATSTAVETVPTQTESIQLETLSNRDPTLVSIDPIGPTSQRDSKTDLQATLDDVPDGGYGWVVVAACSILMFFAVGGSYSWGVIQARLVAQNLGPSSILAFVGSLSISCVALGAIINGKIIRSLGCRNAALLAAASLGGGQILSGFSSRSIGGLFVTNGIVVGFGTGMSFMVSGTMPAQYFKGRRGLANGLVYAGGGIGGAVLAVANDALIERVGVAWTFRTLGFITLAIALPAAALIKERARRPSAVIEWSLFKDPKFLCLLLGSGIATFPLLVPPFFLPLYARSLGISSTVGSILLAAFNLSSALGRVGFGFLCDVTGPVTSLALSLILSAISILAIWPVSNGLPPLLVFIVINGLGNGGFFSTVPSVVGHVYGPRRVTGVLAMIVTAWAFGYMLGSPVAGWILERYGGLDAGRAAYRPAMYYAGSMSLGSAGFVLVARYLVNPKPFSFV